MKIHGAIMKLHCERHYTVDKILKLVKKPENIL